MSVNVLNRDVKYLITKRGNMKGIVSCGYAVNEREGNITKDLLIGWNTLGRRSRKQMCIRDRASLTSLSIPASNS